MKLKFSKLNKKTVYILLACAVVFAAIQSFLVLSYYEADVFLYAHGAVLPGIFNVVLSLFVLGVLVYCSLCTCDASPDKLSDSGPATRILGFLTSAALLAAGITAFVNYSRRSSELMYIAQKQDKFILWSSILTFGAFIYFLLFTFIPNRSNKLKTFLGCITLVWHILYLLSVYFDMTSPLNDPMRLMNEFALVGIMMYLTAEIRYLCGIPKKGFYIGVSVSAFTLLLCSSVSNLLFALGGGTVQGGNLLLYVYQLLAAGYVLTRVLAQIKTEITVTEKVD